MIAMQQALQPQPVEQVEQATPPSDTTHEHSVYAAERFVRAQNLNCNLHT